MGAVRSYERCSAPCEQRECWAGNGPAARQPADAASEKALGTPALLPPGTVISKSSFTRITEAERCSSVQGILQSTSGFG